MRFTRLIVFATVIISLASCGKPETAKNGQGDPCDSAKAQPSYLTQEQSVKACRDNRNFAGAPTKRSHIQVTNH